MEGMKSMMESILQRTQKGRAGTAKDKSRVPRLQGRDDGGLHGSS